MGKFVKGSYANIEEANQAVEELTKQGYDRSLLTLIGNKDTYDKYSNQANTAVNTEHAESDESAWDKVKDFFTSNDVDNVGYEADEEVLQPYQNDIDNGNLVLLVDDFSTESGATDFSNSTPPNTTEEHVVDNPTDDGPTSIPPILDNEDDMDQRRRNSHYTPNENPGNARTPHLTEDMVTGEDTPDDDSYTYEDEVDRSIDTNLLADTDENLLPDDTIDPAMEEGSLGSAASDEATGNQDTDAPVSGTRPGTHDSIVPPYSNNPEIIDETTANPNPPKNFSEDPTDTKDKPIDPTTPGETTSESARSDKKERK